MDKGRVINPKGSSIDHKDLNIYPSSQTIKPFQDSCSIYLDESQKRIEAHSFIEQPFDNAHTEKNLNMENSDQNQNYLPIFKITKTTQKVNLVPRSKGKDEAFPQIMAKGMLVDSNDIESVLNGDFQFQGNFKGVFEFYTELERIVYFEGQITQLKIYSKNGLLLNSEEQDTFKDFTSIRGYFKGIFIPITVQRQFTQSDQTFLHEKIIKKSDSKVEYHVPAFVSMDLRKLESINLQKSSAHISAIFKIEIQLNEDVLSLVYDKDEERFKYKYQLAVDFHRGKPFVLPFYNPSDFQQETDEQEYEWSGGINTHVEWNRQLMKFSYKIQTIFTAEVDNSHGIFFAPFNLSVLRLVVDFHSIKIKHSHDKICINCCDLSDFEVKNGLYSPYVPFQDLQRNLSNKNNYAKMYEKHIDRLTKVGTTLFIDQGEFHIATNRVALFPYHRRVFMNKNRNQSNLFWKAGLTDKNSLVLTPEVASIKQAFAQRSQNEHKVSIFALEQWEFVHIEIPIFKYPIIDMIGIFVPIIILSAISMTMFWQESAKNRSGYTLLNSRIASGCGLMVAYVALIPMVRSNLPPTPSITLVQILIYLSVLPNLLAIISTLIATETDVNHFFRTYRAFTDPLFLISFTICILSFLTLTVMMIVYAFKDYKSSFTIYKFKPSTLRNLRAPAFLSYIQKIRKFRRQFTVEQLEIPYKKFKQGQEHLFD